MHVPGPCILEFRAYCRMAAQFLDMGSPVEFRRALSKAFNLVQSLLRAEYPRILNYFLETFLYLMRRGLPEIVSLLRIYINEMATTTIPREHLWGHIYRLIGMVDAESLEPVVIQSWVALLMHSRRPWAIQCNCSRRSPPIHPVYICIYRSSRGRKASSRTSCPMRTRA